MTKYEAKMAKIAYCYAECGRNGLSKNDISKPAWALKVLRRTDLLLTIICGMWLL